MTTKFHGDAPDLKESPGGHPSDGGLVELQHRYFETRDPDLRSEIVRAYTGLAYRLASRFARRGEPLDDLAQVASVGLILAVDRYDPRTGSAFARFAVPTILGELKRHFRDRAWSMRVPRRLQEIYLEAKTAIDSLTQELGRPPTYGEIADRVGVDEEHLVEALEAGRSFYAVSLNIPVPDDNRQTEIAPGAIDPGFISLENRRFLLALANGLPDRTRHVLELRFSKGMTQSEIARQIGVSQMHVSRILAKAISYMRERAARSA
jgi:RNA polymerase sigma-B factor